jgi:beta-lactam-binding protein with PASTA domain
MYGWSESEVTAEMDRMGLVAHITHRATRDQCYVISQSPQGGTKVAVGSTVDVVVATATGICEQV